MDHAFLHPDHLGAFANGGLDDLGDKFGAAENIHDVDASGDCVQVGIAGLAQNPGLLGVNRNDAVAGALQVFRDPMAGAEAFRGKAHDGDDPRGMEHFRNPGHTSFGSLEPRMARFSFWTS